VSCAPSGTRTPNPLRSVAAFSTLAALLLICVLTCVNASRGGLGLTRCFARVRGVGHGVNRGAEAARATIVRDVAKTVDAKVVDQVSSELGCYVYILVDPRDSRPFYVGKGQGVRFLSHGRAVPEELDETEGPKSRVIRALRTAGLDPEVWIARYA
jgi:hypothetical protein